MAGESASRKATEHDKIREPIAKLRSIGPEGAVYNTRFTQLMREVMHRVADEEAILLPMAERALASQSSGFRMRVTNRCMQLVAQHRPGAIAANTACTFPLESFALMSIGEFAHCPRPASAGRGDRALGRSRLASGAVHLDYMYRDGLRARHLAFLRVVR